MTRTLHLWAISCIALITALICPCQASAQKGHSAFGAQAGYTTTNESAVMGLFYQYGLTDNIRISPEIGCVLRHHHEDAFTADVNLHFPLISQTGIDLYPLCGINVSGWTSHLDGIDNDDVSTRHTKFGLNVGAGYQLQCSPTLLLKFEAKYVFTKKYSTCAITAGVAYCF